MDNLTNETIHKELDLIQSCINRMANNSFLIKGWMITLVVAFVALLADKVSIYTIAGLSTVIILAFWYLDGFFLKTERLFRLKYEWVIEQRSKGNSEYLYDLNPYNSAMLKKVELGKRSVLCMMFTRTLVPFYGLPLVVAICSILWTLWFSCPDLATP